MHSSRNGTSSRAVKLAGASCFRLAHFGSVLVPFRCEFVFPELAELEQSCDRSMFRDSPERRLANRRITLSKRDVDDAKRLLTLLSADELTGAADVDGSGEAVGIPSLVAWAREILVDRRRRYQAFGKAMFGEPAWEILLLLYVLQSGSRTTVSRLADLSGATKSTALRWIDYLESQRWIQREPHPTDKRAVFIDLTRRGREALEVYLSDTLPI